MGPRTYLIKHLTKLKRGYAQCVTSARPAGPRTAPHLLSNGLDSLNSHSLRACAKQDHSERPLPPPHPMLVGRSAQHPWPPRLWQRRYSRNKVVWEGLEQRYNNPIDQCCDLLNSCCMPDPPDKYKLTGAALQLTQKVRTHAPQRLHPLAELSTPPPHAATIP